MWFYLIFKRFFLFINFGTCMDITILSYKQKQNAAFLLDWVAIFGTRNQFLNRLANAHMITYNKNMKSSLGVLGRTKTCDTINSSNDSMFTAHFPSYLTLERKPSGFVYVWLYYIIFEMHVPHFYCIVSFNFVQMNVSMMKTNLLGFCLY